jgi:hypothetical protein
MGTSKNLGSPTLGKITPFRNQLSPVPMKPCSAIKTDLFADDHHRKKIDSLGDPLAEIESHIDFAALAAEVDRVAPRPVSAQAR